MYQPTASLVYRCKHCSSSPTAQETEISFTEKNDAYKQTEIANMILLCFALPPPPPCLLMEQGEISHGFLLRFALDFLLVWACMFVARDVAGSVDHVNTARFAFPAACLVKTLLMRTCELGGVGQTGYSGGCHGSLSSQRKIDLMIMIISQLWFWNSVVCVLSVPC